MSITGDRLGIEMAKPRIVHLTLAKCGSQWVRDVLCAPEIVDCTGVPYSGVTFNLPSAGEFEIPPGEFSGPIFGMSQLEWHGFKSGGDKAIVVLRDPRDRLISLMYSILYSHGTSARGDSYIGYMKSKLFQLKTDSERVAEMIGEVQFWRHFYLTWATAGSDDTYVVRYEDLVKDQRTEFEKIIVWLGWKVPSETLDYVVKKLSFTERSGRNAGVEDVSSHYRRGVAGDWKNHFTREHGQLWNDLYPEFLTLIGYENDNIRWCQSLPKKDSPICHSPDSQVEILTKRNRELERDLFEKETEIRNLAQTCSERLELINQQSRQLDTRSN